MQGLAQWRPESGARVGARLPRNTKLQQCEMLNPRSVGGTYSQQNCAARLKHGKELGMTAHICNSSPKDGELKSSLGYIERLCLSCQTFLSKKGDR